MAQGPNLSRNLRCSWRCQRDLGIQLLRKEGITMFLSMGRVVLETLDAIEAPQTKTQSCSWFRRSSSESSLLSGWPALFTNSMPSWSVWQLPNPWVDRLGHLDMFCLGPLGVLVRAASQKMAANNDREKGWIKGNSTVAIESFANVPFEWQPNMNWKKIAASVLGIFPFTLRIHEPSWVGNPTATNFSN